MVEWLSENGGELKVVETREFMVVGELQRI